MLIDSVPLTAPDWLLTKALNPNMTPGTGAQRYYLLCYGAMEKIKNSSAVIVWRNKIYKGVLEPCKDFMQIFSYSGSLRLNTNASKMYTLYIYLLIRTTLLHVLKLYINVFTQSGDLRVMFSLCDHQIRPRATFLTTNKESFCKVTHV